MSHVNSTIVPLHSNFAPATQTSTLQKLPSLFVRNSKGKLLFDEYRNVEITLDDFSLFDEAFLRSHLVRKTGGGISHLTGGELAMLNDTYIEIRDKAFAVFENKIAKNQFAPADAPEMVVVIGNSGAGKSHLIEKLSPQNYVFCSADDFLKEIPGFKGICDEVNSYGTEHGDAHHGYGRERLLQARELYRPMAQFMVAMLMQEAKANHLPILAEVTGTSMGIVTMLENAQRKEKSQEGKAAKPGMKVSAHICVADMGTCLEAGVRRRHSYNPIFVTEGKLQQDQAKIIENIPAIFAALKGPVSLHARYGINEPLKIVAAGTATTYTVNRLEEAKFYTEFGHDNGLSLPELMGRRMSQAGAPAPVLVKA